MDEDFVMLPNGHLSDIRTRIRIYHAHPDAIDSLPDSIRKRFKLFDYNDFDRKERCAMFLVPIPDEIASAYHLKYWYTAKIKNSEFSRIVENLHTKMHTESEERSKYWPVKGFV